MDGREKKDTAAATARNTQRLSVGSCGNIRKRCSAGMCRDTKPKSPQRQLRLPRQRVRKNAAPSYPSGSFGPAISYTVHDSSRRSEPVHNPSKRWLAQKLHKLAPQYCRPGGPAIVNHLIRHDAQNQEARRLVALDARN